MGVILVILAGIVLAGGGRRIFLAAERLVPLSAGLYTAAALAVIILYAGNVPGVILGILADAFPSAAPLAESRGTGSPDASAMGSPEVCFPMRRGSGVLQC